MGHFYLQSGLPGSWDGLLARQVNTMSSLLRAIPPHLNFLLSLSCLSLVLLLWCISCPIASDPVSLQPRRHQHPQMNGKMPACQPLKRPHKPYYFWDPSSPPRNRWKGTQPKSLTLLPHFRFHHLRLYPKSRRLYQVSLIQPKGAVSFIRRKTDQPWSHEDGRRPHRWSMRSVVP